MKKEKYVTHVTPKLNFFFILNVTHVTPRAAGGFQEYSKFSASQHRYCTKINDEKIKFSEVRPLMNKIS